MLARGDAKNFLQFLVQGQNFSCKDFTSLSKCAGVWCRGQLCSGVVVMETQNVGD